MVSAVSVVGAGEGVLSAVSAVMFSIGSGIILSTGGELAVRPSRYCWSERSSGFPRCNVSRTCPSLTLSPFPELIRS